MGLPTAIRCSTTMSDIINPRFSNCSIIMSDPLNLLARLAVGLDQVTEEELQGLQKLLQEWVAKLQQLQAQRNAES